MFKFIEGSSNKAVVDSIDGLVNVCPVMARPSAGGVATFQGISH
jgi:hypothetical protein